jgi:translation initiation factor 1
MQPPQDHRLVYSSETGSVRYCPRCGQPAHPGRCPTKAQSAAQGLPRDGIIRVAIERSGRRGKTVTAIHGLPADDAALAQIAKTLKQLAGSGGTVQNGVIELQGDHRQRVATHLTAAGYKVKLAGG